MKPSVAFVILMCLCEAVAVPRALSGNVKDVFRLEKRQQDTGTSDGELLMIFWQMPAELIDNSAQFPGCILCGCTFRHRVSSLFSTKSPEDDHLIRMAILSSDRVLY